MIVTTRKHSYLLNTNDLTTVELGSIVFDPKENKMYLVSAPGVLTEIGADALEELVQAIGKGGEVNVNKNIDAPASFEISKDTTIINNGTISISKDTEGNGVFMVTNNTLTLDGKGTVNGLSNNPYSMAVWVKGNGKVIINDGYFTNVGAYSEEDGSHFDLIYASENGQVEINGGEFKCETPIWTLNIKNNARETAKIVVKGGKFHGFDPSKAEEGNFVAEGYKVVETNGIFEVIPE